MNKQTNLYDSHVESSLLGELFTDVSRRLRRRRERRLECFELFSFDCCPRSSAFRAGSASSVTGRRLSTAVHRSADFVALVLVSVLADVVVVRQMCSATAGARQRPARIVTAARHRVHAAVVGAWQSIAPDDVTSASGCADDAAWAAERRRDNFHLQCTGMRPVATRRRRTGAANCASAVIPGRKWKYRRPMRRRVVGKALQWRGGRRAVDVTVGQSVV